MEELKALNEEHEKLNNSHASLVGKHEELLKKYACATNASSCAAALKKKNIDLKYDLEVLTSKHVTMQKDHEEHMCSHEALQDSHAMLQVAHEVVLTSVKFYQPLTQNCTCSQKSIEFICANSYCSQSQHSNVEQIVVESCDDFIAQENDQLKLEVKRLKDKVARLMGKVQVQPSQDNHDNMVKKLEMDTTVTRPKPQPNYKSPRHKKQEKKNLDHIQCFKCSDMGHYSFMCSTMIESKARLSRRQRKLINAIV
ncbi:hypothetical protein QOZ80_7AG0575700 [Eleusine coracana subsp. coracana]|nr:hypothetical protein QOZ80_7AG0575700 [Eleusine coracana subsp. coracana]